MSLENHPVDKIRVVHVASGDLWGGAEAQLYVLAKELRNASDLVIHIVLLNHGILEKRLKGLQIPVTVLDEQTLGGFQILQALRRFLVSFRANIVHTHRQKENVVGSLAAFSLKRCKSLRTVHGSREFAVKPWQVRKLIYRLTDWLCGRFLQDCIVAVSQGLGESLARSFPASKVRVITNGVDLDEIERASREPAAIPGPDTVLKVAFVGRLVPVKRVDIFLEIAQQLIATDKDRYRFYIYGDGPLGRQVESDIESRQLGKYIYLMGFRDDLPSHLMHIDTVIITSDHEGLPTSLLEALALNVSVIAHAVGEIPRVLDNGKYGDLVNTQDPSDYVRKIEALPRKKKSTELKKTAHWAHIADHYSVRQVANNYKITYWGLIA